MKLGIDRKNGHISSLSSWLSLYSAEPGAFTLDWDPSEHQLKSGSGGRFAGVVVSLPMEDSVDDQIDPSQWVLNVLGRLHDFDLKVDIARADYCYGYNSDGGCERWEQPGCTHVGDQFELQQGYFQAITISASSFIINSNTSLGYSDCKATCWNYCGCLGFNYRFSNHTGCQFWTGNWKFIKDLTDDDSRIFVYTTKPTPTISVYAWRWIGSGIAVALLVMMFSILSCLLRRRKAVLSGEIRKKVQNELLNLMKCNRSTDVNVVQNDGNMEHHDLSVFSYASIMAATCNFSKENKLGEGGFGPVYKGKLMTGPEIAVKRLLECSGRGTLEFKNELQHTNLVQLFGFCIHGDERMLIYEYMPNKSLDYFLFDSTRALLLNWKTLFWPHQ